MADGSLDRVLAFELDLHVTVACDIHTGCAAAAAARNFFLLHGNIVEGQLELINGVVNDLNDARADSAGVYSRRGSGSGFCRSRGFLLALCLFLGLLLLSGRLLCLFLGLRLLSVRLLCLFLRRRVVDLGVARQRL